MFKFLCLAALVTLCIAEQCINDYDACPNPSDGDYARSHDSVIYCCDKSKYELELYTEGGVVLTCECVPKDGSIDTSNDNDDNNNINSNNDDTAVSGAVACINDYDACPNPSDGDYARSHEGVMYCCDKNLYELSLLTAGGLVTSCECLPKSGDSNNDGGDGNENNDDGDDGNDDNDDDNDDVVNTQPPADFGDAETESCINDYDSCPNPSDGDFARSHGGIMYCCDSRNSSFMNLLTADGEVVSCECILKTEEEIANSDNDDVAATQPPADFGDAETEACINDYDSCPNPSDGDFARSHGGIMYCCDRSTSSFMNLFTAGGEVVSCECILKDEDQIGNDVDSTQPPADFGDAETESCINDYDSCPNPSDGDFARSHGGIMYCCDRSTSSFMNLLTAGGEVVSCECILKDEDQIGNDVDSTQPPADFGDAETESCINDYDSCPNPSDGDFARSHGGIMYCCDSGRSSFMNLLTADGEVVSCECILKGEDEVANDVNDNNDNGENDENDNGDGNNDDSTDSGPADYGDAKIGDCIIDDYDACPNPSDGDFARAHEGILYCCDSSTTSFMDLYTANGKVESCRCILGDNTGNDNTGGNDNNDSSEQASSDNNASDGEACINDRDACPNIDDTEFTRAHEGIIYCCDKSTSSFMDLITADGLVVSCRCVPK